MQNFEEKRTIKVGEIYKHSSGTTYRINEILWSADGYEESGLLPEAIIYTQLENGKAMPAGTRYTRTATNFLKNFELIEERLRDDNWER